MFEANQILSIPISLRLPEDKLIWHWEKDGTYSVRSAYHLLSAEQRKDQPEASSASNNGLWKEIWRVSAPNCVRNFLWRLVSNILPTRSNLGKKGMKLDPVCPICNSEDESQDHLFLHCHGTKLMWFFTALSIHIPHQQHLNAWLLQWLSKADPMAKQIVSISLWMIWKARNQVVFNKTVFNPIEVATKAADFIQEFNKENKSVTKSPHPQSLEPWEPPLQSYTKINVDAGCFPNGYTGWGMIARSYKEVIYTATKLDNLHMSPSLAEAVGIKWCLQWVKNNQMARIIVESDAEVVVNCINGTTKLAVIDHVVLDCKEMLAQMEHVSVVSVHRSKNMAAHGLVQVARDLGSRTWVGNVPTQIYQTVCKDSLFSVQ